MCSNCCSIIFQSYGVLTQCGFYHMNSSHSAMILNSLILQENGAGVKKFCPNCTVLRLIFQFLVQWLIFEKSSTNMYGRKIIPQNMYFQEILGIFQSHQTTNKIALCEISALFEDMAILSRPIIFQSGSSRVVVVRLFLDLE